MKLIKKWNRNFTQKIKENKSVFIAAFLLIFFLTISYTVVNKHFAQRDQKTLCIADYFVLVKDPFFIYFANVLIAIFILSFILKSNFRISYIIRHKSMASIFNEQAYFTLLTALVISFYQTISTTAIAIYNCNTLINFHEKSSYFYYITDGFTINISFIQVFIYTFIFGFLFNSLMCLLFLFIKWLTNFELISFIFIIVIAFLDIYTQLGLSTVFGTSYNNFISFNIFSLFVPLILFLIIFGVSVVLIKRKEFLNAK